jgi:UDP-glucose-4-epimerase GalE
VESVLVTGGAGYIGSHTCKALAGAGFRPITLDNLVYGHRRAVKWGPFVEGDLADGALLESVMREHSVTAVVHFAAYAYVGESMQQPGKYFANNVANTLGLLDVMRAIGVRHIVFSSTCATYGIPEQTPIDEQHPQHPVNPYGESKLFVERALKWYGVAHGLKWSALRYFNAAGADAEGELGEDHTPETHLIPLIIQAALGLRPHVKVFGTDYPTQDGTAVRDYIHVTDLAEAHVRALEHLFNGGESLALNLGTGLGHSVREVISSVERASGKKVPTRDAPRRAGDPPELVANAAQAQRRLGWRPRHSSLENITTTAWSWHLSQQGSLYQQELDDAARA